MGKTGEVERLVSHMALVGEHGIIVMTCMGPVRLSSKSRFAVKACFGIRGADFEIAVL